MNTSIVPIDLLALATNPLYFTTLSATNITTPAISLLSYNPTFNTSVVYPNATATLLEDFSWQAFHEGGVYDSATNALYIASNFQSLDNPINLTTLHFSNDSTYTVESITSTRFANLYEANGGTSYYPVGGDISSPPSHQIWCDEGDFTHYSSLVDIDPSTNDTAVVVNTYLGQKNFSSPNDVRQHPVTGDLWFTDAAYGYFQFFRPEPVMPQQVYRFSPGTGEIQVVADGFDQPNGLVCDLSSTPVSNDPSSATSHETPILFVPNIAT